MESNVTLRERKKQATRNTIIVSAFKLFAKRGYDHTSISDIAGQALIAPRTFFLYFESKEDLLFAHIDRLCEDLSDKLATRKPEATTLEVIRDWVARLNQDAKKRASDDFSAAYQQIMRTQPALEGRKKLHLANNFQTVIEPHLAKDLRLPPNSVKSKMIAAMTTAAFESIYDQINHDLAHTSILVNTDIAIRILERGFLPLGA